MQPLHRHLTSRPSTSRPSAPFRRRAGFTAAVCGAAALALTACGQAEREGPQQPAETEAPASDALASATLNGVDGNELGIVELGETDGGLQVSADLSGLEPGFYGFHVHQIGACEPDSAAPDDPSDTGAFKSAGGHIGADESEHPTHAGDLPPLLVTEDGTARLEVTTDRLTEENLMDDDGAAFMIHSLPDNFANIPERYAPGGPDADTTGTGDAGDRFACGVVE